MWQMVVPSWQLGARKEYGWDSAKIRIVGPCYFSGEEYFDVIIGSDASCLEPPQCDTMRDA